VKQAILFAIFITVAPHLLFARTGSSNNNNNYPETEGNYIISTDIPDARQMLSEIMNVVGLKPNFELKKAKVANIEAFISHRKRYILYNPEFINRINKATKDKWAAIALMAHEVGHHLNGHTIKKSGSTPTLELEADEFAGFVLHKLGATLEQAQEVMKYIAGNEASKTHPSKTSRMLAIQNGWSKAANSEVIIATVKK
jgi:hypothetical protein